MLDSLTAAWKLGRDSVGTWHPGSSSAAWSVRQHLYFAGLPTDVDHIRAFRDGAKDGAAGKGD